jgi:enoyl-CoA hydratase/carnithine racemase
MRAYHLETKNDLGILHLHASNANAMNDRVLEAIATGLQETRAKNLNGLVLTGHDRFFSAGLDLIEVYQFDREEMRRFILHWETVMIELFGFPMPVVAAVNGAAAAGGCIMALACDYRVMAEDALIGMTGIRLGISLPAAALEIAREVVPATNLAYVLYSGKLFESGEALKLGLINEVVSQENLIASALARLREFTQHNGTPAASLKSALRQNALARIKQSAEELREKFLEIWFSPAARRGVEEMRNELLKARIVMICGLTLIVKLLIL